MGWRRTVRCSYCYEEGHNRAGCPKRKKDAEKDPEGYQARQLKREQERRKMSVDSRRCSYCNGDERGGHIKHNRRGCSLLRLDKAEIRSRIKEYRRQVMEVFQRLGFGIGALVQFPSDGGKLVYMIDHINWDAITHRLGGERWGDGPEDSYALDYAEKEPLMGRLISWEFTEEPRYWVKDKLRPMYREGLSLRNLYLDNLSPKCAVDLTVHEERHQGKLISGISSARALELIPSNFMDGNTTERIMDMYNFNSGHRVRRLYEKKDESNG